MMFVDPFRRFFIEPDPHEQAVGECNEIIEFSKTAYFQVLMAYLERGADEPLQIGSETSMVSSASRVNTFKEIKKHLQSQIKNAEIVLQRERSNA